MVYRRGLKEWKPQSDRSTGGRGTIEMNKRLERECLNERVDFLHY